MTDLPFDYPSEPTANVSTKRCRRHQWMQGGTTFDLHCARCGKVRDEAVAKRNKRNRQRGSAFERTVAKKLGGRRTGPLGGRDDVMVGALFVAQTKRQQRFSLAEARTYLTDLARTYSDRTPIVVHAFPGERGGVVIVDLDAWVALHGPDATKGEV